MKLFIVILLGFIVPWIIGIYLYTKDKKTVAVIAPFSSMLAFVLNEFGIQFGLFQPLPVYELKSFSALFVNAGMFAIEPCIYIYFLRQTKFRPVILNIIISIFATFIEYLLVSAGYIMYSEYWNIIYTYLSFFAAFMIVYLYYLLLVKIKVFHANTQKQ